MAPEIDPSEISSQESTQPPEGGRVGYGRPPVTTRFQKGNSGNPKGRPKGSLNLATVFTKTLREKVVINESGRRRTVTKLEAALKQLVNRAAGGDLRALRQLVELSRDAEAKQSVSGAPDPITKELDQEVLDGIMKRFKGEEEKASKDLPEVDDVNDQHG